MRTGYTGVDINVAPMTCRQTESKCLRGEVHIWVQDKGTA